MSILRNPSSGKIQRRAGKIRRGSAGDPCCCGCDPCASFYAGLPSSVSLDVSGAWAWAHIGDDPAYVCQGQVPGDGPATDSVSLALDVGICNYVGSGLDAVSIGGFDTQPGVGLTYVDVPTTLPNGTVLPCGWQLDFSFVGAHSGGESNPELLYFLAGTSPIGEFDLVYAHCEDGTDVTSLITDHRTLVTS